MGGTCLYPHRNPVTGAFCRSRNIVRVPDVYPYTVCAHHLGVMKDTGEWVEVQHAPQCEAEWPSPVSGGLTDARCIEPATVEVDDRAYCARCAGEVTS